MISVTKKHIGKPVSWRKAGRAAGERQRGILIGFVDEGTTGEEVYESIPDYVRRANAYLRENKRPPVDLDLSSLYVARRHISFALDTVKTERVLVMAPHKTGAPSKRQWYCPNAHDITLA